MVEKWFDYTTYMLTGRLS